MNFAEENGYPADRLYLIAERFAREFDLFQPTDSQSEFKVSGLLTEAQIRERFASLERMDIDSYIEAVVSPAETPDRENAPNVIRRLGRIREEYDEGPFYAVVLEMQFPSGERRIGIVAQNRRHRNGEWLPEHHFAAAKFARTCCLRRIPIVSFMDTPGAAGDEVANRNNQAHNISRLIAEMSDVEVPNVGIIFGLGYSGGAIPLAASNIILSVRDGVFSTIQPRSLASIARRLNLSWQECAKHVGLSPFELYVQGNIDGIIDFVPGESEKEQNLRNAIVSAITSIEDNVKKFVAQNPYIIDHYRLTLNRFLNPSPRLQHVERLEEFGESNSPTEYQNVFGVAYRYLRYLRVRRRIKATSKQQYGRLSHASMPEGELRKRMDRDRRRTFLRWLEDPDRVIYDDALKSAWNLYLHRRETQSDTRGQFAKLVLGEPKKNFQIARDDLLSTVGVYLYNRWKTEAAGNLESLSEFLSDIRDSRYLVRADGVLNPADLIRAINHDALLGPALLERFTFDGKKLLGTAPEEIARVSKKQLQTQLSVELNLALTGGPLEFEGLEHPSTDTGPFERNWRTLVGRLYGLIEHTTEATDTQDLRSVTILDLLRDEDLRSDFVAEIDHLRLFDAVYDEVLNSMDTIASEADETQTLDRYTVKDLIQRCFANAIRTIHPDHEFDDAEINRKRDAFLLWFRRLANTRGIRKFLLGVEEWKKSLFAHFSDTLFTVATFFFERLLVSYIRSEWEGATYDGRIRPTQIGRKRDFWNRLNIAYRDLQIQNVLNGYKRKRLSGYTSFLNEFFEDFEELYADRLSTDPCDFPGFRVSIEQALEKDEPPAGVITGIGRFALGDEGIKVGAIISNASFQAGAFDMASAEKFCRLMVRCAEEQLPLICFISSGGMQTKEGAGALFSMAAINDRITRFVRDFDLPVIIFGYGDCTGGAQASFVTHPLVHTFYFSGTSMPFAGQIVIPSNLPLDSILSNYLATVQGSMEGLVKHPFHAGLDDDLRQIDPTIPVPTLTVREVVKDVLSGDFEASEAVAVPQRMEVDERELYRPVHRVLVHARGCAASKIVQIAQSRSIDVVLVQSDPDVESVAADMLSERDTLVSIGGSTPDESYLNARSVLAIAEHENVDALHPGIGFLSESSAFAELVRSHRINFIGPPVSSMETMGNKSNAINTALSLGVPVVPGSHGIVTDVDAAVNIAEEIGYPVLIKAVHGGGGKGIQVVESASQFRELYSRVTVEARAAFGNGDVYLEKYVTSLRHIESQILRDSHGNTRVLGIRDCSVQRNKQKVFEESGSTMLPDTLLADVLEHSEAIANAVNYVGAGTVEFIYDLHSDAVYFMEMNTRLQVEHPVTELVSGVDIVGEQFQIAGGGSIEDLEVRDDGYAIEARINAEKIARDPEGNLVFRPSAGSIDVCEIPEDSDVAVITTAGTGKFISPYYDSMIMQVIAHGRDRSATAKKLDDFLSRVRIRGISTNIALLRRVLADDQFGGGEYDTAFLTSFFARTDIDSLIAEIQQASGDESSEIGLDAIRIEGSDELKVVSPTTGIFYLKPSPNEPDYVHVDDVVAVADTMCQLEAFKVFTPLHLGDFVVDDSPLYSPDTRFRIKRINVSTGQQVNAGDLLFVIQPEAPTSN